MEQHFGNSLERIENPILVILLVVLVAACGGLWLAYRGATKQLMEVMLQTAQALTNLNATLSNMKDRLDGIEEEISKKRTR